MSGGLVPSKSTVYVTNLPFGLQNNDIYKLFEKHGRIVKVTVMKDKITRKSKGVAFILFLRKEDAQKCIQETNMLEMFGRTLKASIAKDNGRCTEFIRRREYPDKSRCFECGELGHVSYKCPKNLLGERPPPPKKVRRRKPKEPQKLSKEQIEYFDSSDDERDETKCDDDGENKDDEELFDEETLSAAIALEHEKKELEKYRYKVATGNYREDEEENTLEPKKKRIKKSAYFSDEEESD